MFRCCFCCRKNPSVDPFVLTPVQNKAYKEARPRGVEIEVQTDDFYSSIEDLEPEESQPQPEPFTSFSSEPVEHTKVAKDEEEDENSPWGVVIKELVKRQESREPFDHGILTRLESVGRLGPTPTVYRQLDEISSGSSNSESTLDDSSSSVAKKGSLSDISAKNAVKLAPTTDAAVSGETLVNIQVTVSTSNSLSEGIISNSLANTEELTTVTPAVDKTSLSTPIVQSTLSVTDVSSALETPAEYSTVDSSSTDTALSSIDAIVAESERPALDKDLHSLNLSATENANKVSKVKCTSLSSSSNIEVKGIVHASLSNSISLSKVDTAEVARTAATDEIATSDHCPKEKECNSSVLTIDRDSAASVQHIRSDSEGTIRSEINGSSSNLSDLTDAVNDSGRGSFDQEFVPVPPVRKRRRVIHI